MEITQIVKAVTVQTIFVQLLLAMIMLKIKMSQILTVEVNAQIVIMIKNAILIQIVILIFALLVAVKTSIHATMKY